MSAVIAIVGRPNVGKSALFNRIARRRIAIVHDQPGVTRDRVSAELEWQGRPFTLIDTGGLGLRQNEKAPDALTAATRAQVELAIEAAAVILMVVDTQAGVMSQDREVAAHLRVSGKQIFLVANKADHQGMEEQTTEFSELGFDGIFPVSALHDRGMSGLMAAIYRLLPAAVELDEASEGPAPLKLAIVGRPNVGKSSLVNALAQSDRVIVSPIPGTTRDSVDVPLIVETEGVRQSYVLIDTAGMRKARRVDDSIEFFSVKRAEDSISRCDLAILVLDAEAGVTEQDKKIAGKILEHNKACVVVVNKWDLVAESVREAQVKERERRKTRRGNENKTSLGEFGSWVQEQIFFLDYAPVIFTSALDGFHLDRLLESVRYVTAQLQQKIPTALLNRSLQDAIVRRQPVSSAGSRLKFFYATQVAQAPPTFVLFVNRTDLFSDPYRKYLTHSLHQAFGYEGCPILLRARARRRVQLTGGKGGVRSKK